MDEYHDLVAKKKCLDKEMHLLHSTLGNSKGRDLSLHIDPLKGVNTTENTTFQERADRIQRDQERQYKKNYEQELFLAANKTTMKPSHKNYVHTPKETKEILQYTTSFGGKSSACTNSFKNFHDSNIRHNARSFNDFGHESNDYNNTVIRHNKLCQEVIAPRTKRNTLMLSNLGFKSHCSDIALEIVKILKEKNT